MGRCKCKGKCKGKCMCNAAAVNHQWNGERANSKEKEPKGEWEKVGDVRLWLVQSLWLVPTAG